MNGQNDKVNRREVETIAILIAQVQQTSSVWSGTW